MSGPPTLHVVVTVAVDDATLVRLRRLEPRLELVQPRHLLAPMRHAADFAANPEFRRSDAEQEEYERILGTAEAWLGIPDVDPALLARVARRAPDLRWIHTMAAGGGSQIREAGLSAAELAGLAITTSAGVHAAPLAEFALLGLLAGLKRLPELEAQRAERTWDGRRFLGQLAESSVLVLGVGGIGTAVIRHLQALGAHVVAVSRRNTAVPGADEVIKPERLTDAVGRVDGLVAALPDTASTRGMVGVDVLAAARPGLTVVNVGRGSVIDERALVDALRDGRVGFAALDVFEHEPLPAQSPLWRLPNVLVSPHTAALSAREEERIAALFADNARRLLDRLPLRNRMNTCEFY